MHLIRKFILWSSVIGFLSFNIAMAQAQDFSFFATADPQYDITGHFDSSGKKCTGHQSACDDNKASNATLAAIGKHINDLEKKHEHSWLVVSGDLTQNTEVGEMRMFNNAVAPYANHVLAGLGNHDQGSPTWRFDCGFSATGDLRNSCVSRDYVIAQTMGMAEQTVPLDYRDDSVPMYSWDWPSKQHPVIHFVQVSLAAANDPNPDFHYRQALDKLQEDLKTYVGDSGRPVIVFQHFPLYVSDDEWWSQQQIQAEFNVLKQYNTIATFTGHYHLTGSDDDTYWAHSTDAMGNGKTVEDFISGAALYGIYMRVDFHIGHAAGDDFFTVNRYQVNPQDGSEKLNKKFGPFYFSTGSHTPLTAHITAGGTNINPGSFSAPLGIGGFDNDGDKASCNSDHGGTRILHIEHLTPSAHHIVTVQNTNQTPELIVSYMHNIKGPAGKCYVSHHMLLQPGQIGFLENSWHGAAYIASLNVYAYAIANWDHRDALNYFNYPAARAGQVKILEVHNCNKDQSC